MVGDDLGSAHVPAGTDLLSELLLPLRLEGDGVSERTIDGGAWVEISRGQPAFYLVQAQALHLRCSELLTIGNPGDLLMLPTGSAHAVKAPAGSPAVFVSGSFGYQGKAVGSVLDSLPPVICVRRDQGGNSEWLAPLVHFLLAETKTPAPGAAIMISRLIDVLVLRTLRSWALADEERGRGWLGGLSDTRIERALSAMHADPMHDWTLAGLASLCAMSRSSFSARFAACTGEPPLRYLKNWRLALARDQLASGSRKVGEVGHEIGYESEAAFSRAYRSRFGHPPRAARPH